MKYKNLSSSDVIDEPCEIEYTKQDKFYNNQEGQSTNSASDNVEANVKPEWIPEKKKSYPYIVSHPVSVFDVAAYIVKKMGTMTTMKLHKLLYYCQAWSLVWDESPLFAEPIEAWANGPVVKNLFAYHKGMYSISSIPIGNPDLLSATQKETIDAVLDFYGKKSSQWLIDLAHMEKPWRAARADLPALVRGNRIITLESMADYYSSLPSNE